MIDDYIGQGIAYGGWSIGLKKRFSHLRAITGIMHGSKAFGGPVQASLSMISRCNLRCIHCYFYSPYLEQPARQPLSRIKPVTEVLTNDEDLKRTQRMEVDTNRFRVLIDELLKMGTRRYQFTGKGEEFMHKSALEFMGILKHSGSYCVANSNGTLLNPSVVDELVKMKFDHLRITTMAGTAEMYSCTHPGSSKDMFSKIEKNLLYLAEQKNIFRSRSPKVTLVFILIAQNVDGVLDFAKFAANVGAEQVLFIPVDDIEDTGLGKLVPTKEQAANVLKQLIEARVYLESKRIFHNINNFKKVFGTQLDTTALYRVIPCYYGWLSTIIGPDGDVFACCRCYEPFGNIYKKSFSEIWNGNAYRKFRREAVTINKRKKPVNNCDCNSCVHHTANLRVFKILHPLKGRTAQLKELCPATTEEEM